MGYPVAGIDPGVNGGVAVLGVDSSILYVQGFKGKMTHKELVHAVYTANLILCNAGGNAFFVEKVGFIKGDGGLGAFTFGQVAGLLRGAALALGATVHDVYPFMWQSRLNCLSGGNKNVTKKKAQEIWPSEKWTHAIADAALIAEYGRRVLAGVR